MFRSGGRIALIVGLSVMATMLGCGEQAPKLVQAKGYVSFQGKPLTAGSIAFFPDDSNEYRKDNPSSLLQLDGSFTMKTFPFGEGVPVGKYRVTLSPELANRIGRPKLSDPATTPWSIEVSDTGVDDYRIEVE